MDQEHAPHAALPAATDGATELPDPNFDPLADEDTQMNPPDASDADETSSRTQQQPNCDASEAPPPDLAPSSALLAAAAGAPDLRRSSSSNGVAAPRGAGYGIGAGIGRRSRSRSGGDDGDRASSELVLQLQRLCRRQRQRSEERAFVRDVERVLALLKVQTPPSTTGLDATSATFPGPGLSFRDGEMLGSVQEEDEAGGEERRSSVGSNASTFSSMSSMSSSDRAQMSRVTLTLAEIDTLLDCVGDLFDHRNPSVRTLAFEVVQLCVLRFGERLTPALRRKIYLRLETHPAGDFLLRQKALRALTQDGRHLEPFHVELGWFLLRLLEQSDAQRDLLGLIQSVLRRSPRALDRDKVIAIVSVISTRCDMAWSRSDLDACHRFVAFFHVLAVHDLAYAAGTPACLRSLCCLVNADGHGTWSVMKLLLNGSSGFFVLRGLLQILEHPSGASSPWVLRGAVFFVGMSCWGSQRVPRFDDIAWAPILLALEQALQCCRGVVIFEVILSLQRLIKKFGASTGSGQHTVSSGTQPTSHPRTNSQDVSAAGGTSSSTSNSSSSRDKRRLVMEWDIILRMLETLRPWISMTDENEIEEAPQRTMHADMGRSEARVHRTAAIHPANSFPDQQQFPVSIQQTRIPRELLDTLLAVEELVEQRQFAGDVDEFLSVLEDYLPHLSENSMLFLLRQRAEAAHPGYHLDWLATLSSAMRTFFSCIDADGDTLPIPSTVRLEALEILRVNLWVSRNVCEDRVLEEVVIPTLGRVYEDPDAEVRRRGLGFIIEVARQLESVKFDSLLDIIASAMTLSSNEDAQLVAASGVVALFSSAFDHLPPARAVRMYDLLSTTVETHRSRAVRHIALSSLLYVCEARATDGKLQWKEQQKVRTSRFLFVSRRAARTNAAGLQLTAACVPVARALRALLTLVSAEPDAEIFRMAVQGIKTMLENRVILEDVDVSEVSAKLVASIDYRAFGRAAISDEVERQLSEQLRDQNSSDTNAEALVPQNQKSREEFRGRSSRPIPLTDTELVRSIHASTRPMGQVGGGNAGASFCSSMRATAALLAKTMFLAMGIELLQLLISYEEQLQQSALLELARCLIGSMELRLAVAEKDLFAGAAAAEEPTLSSSASSPSILYQHGQARSQADDTDPFASDTPLGFTSRVLSRFQTSASHGNLFHALSGSVSKSSLSSSSAATPPRPSRKDRARLRELLRQLFHSEFKLLHTTTTALGLLVLLAPASILSQLDQLLQNLREIVTTVDGDFRPDAFVAVLELLTTLTVILPRGQEDIALSARKGIMEALLLGFEYAKSKQLAYLSFRLLCQVIHQSNFAEKISLGTLALPTLQACTRRANSLLAEAAVDFLMCFAFSQSAMDPPALRSRQFPGKGETRTTSDDSPQTRSRSWVYRRSLLTITTDSRGDATLIIRRANCTSRWNLDAYHDLSLKPEGSTLHLSQLPVESESNAGGSSIAAHRSLNLLSQRFHGLDVSRQPSTPKRKSLPAELRPSYPSQPNPRPTISSQHPENHARMEHKAEPSYQGVDSYDQEEIEADDERGEGNSTMQSVSVATALPPLPAYDGIGGSPSYYCENAQVSRQPQRSDRSTSRRTRKSARQEKGDDAQESSPRTKPAIRVIREDVEEYGDDDTDSLVEEEDVMDAFSLDGSTRDRPTIPAVTPRVLQFVDQSDARDSNFHEPSTFPNEEQYDPMHLMLLLFDLTVENRPQLLSDGQQLKLALSVLDRTPEYETHKIGLLYVRDAKQSSESAILGNTGGSLRYLRFLRGLGAFTKLEGLPGYTGGLDTANNTDGKFGLVYKDACAQIMFHVATMMIPEGSQSEKRSPTGNFASMKKKRHIGNDFVHVVFKECDEEYDLQTLSGQFNDVHIVIQPLNDREYRTEVHVKPGIPAFGPLYGKQIVSSSIISESVRLTCLNANLVCQVFHQDLVGFALNCEERLKQIKQLGLRLACGDEWKLDDCM